MEGMPTNNEEEKLKSAAEIAMERVDSEEIKNEPEEKLKSAVEIAMGKAEKMTADEKKEKQPYNYIEEINKERQKVVDELDLDYLKSRNPLFNLKGEDGKIEKFQFFSFHPKYDNAVYIRKFDKETGFSKDLFEVPYKKIVKDNPQFYGEDVKDKINEIKKETDENKLKEIIKNEYARFFQYAKEKGYEFQDLANYNTKKFSDEDWEFYKDTFGRNRTIFNAEKRMKELGFIHRESFKEEIFSLEYNLEDEALNSVYGQVRVRNPKISKERVDEITADLLDKGNEGKNKQKENLDKGLTRENMISQYKKGKPIEVKIMDSGRIEDGWRVGILHDDPYNDSAVIFKETGKNKMKMRDASIEELIYWNKPDIERKKLQEDLKENITKSKSLDDLEKIIEESYGIQDSQEFFDSKALKYIIEKVRKGEEKITAITRTGGLRQKVEDLLALEKVRGKLELK